MTSIGKENDAVNAYLIKHSKRGRKEEEEKKVWGALSEAVGRTGWSLYGCIRRGGGGGRERDRQTDRDRERTRTRKLYFTRIVV